MKYIYHIQIITIMVIETELIKEKSDLIEKIIQCPLEFNESDFKKLVTIELNEETKEAKYRAQLNFDDLRKMIIRIFDINESTLKQQSDATIGILGELNKRSTAIRKKRYYTLIDNNFRDFINREKKVIVAEGDSWFQFPVFIKDILDWLSDEPNFAVYSMAYGGDWFTNILYDEKYIEELSIHRPEVFLISAGGNDLLGSNRLAAMVDAKQTQKKPNHVNDIVYLKLLGEEKAPEFATQLKEGYRYILPSFYSFLWIIKAQYWMLFNRLKLSGKFNEMKIITQGYDYPVPTDRLRYKKFFNLQPLVNKFAGSGKWLKRPLKIQGIHDDNTCRCIIKAMIFELNCVFADLASNYNFNNVYHIDCRGVAKDDDCWWDEIHLHSEGFKEIAEAYKRCINGKTSSKVIRVINPD